MGNTLAEGDFIGCGNVLLEADSTARVGGITVTEAFLRCGVSRKTYYE